MDEVRNPLIKMVGIWRIRIQRRTPQRKKEQQEKKNRSETEEL
jgi:hypothetical protein